MDKSELLGLLNDDDVREKILSIMNQQTDDTQEKLLEANDAEQQRAESPLKHQLTNSRRIKAGDCAINDTCPKN